LVKWETGGDGDKGAIVTVGVVKGSAFGCEITSLGILTQ
jgi:hypothetical protein